MSYRQLFFFIEGPDDERIIRRIIADTPKLRSRWDYIECVLYAQRTKTFVDSLVKSIKSTSSADYVFLTDQDLSPCITQKKEKVCKTLQEVTDRKVLVVAKEIEAWYLAGASKKFLQKNRVSILIDRSHLTKEQFDAMIPKRYDSRANWMIEMLKEFSAEDARRISPSFAYFMNKVLAT